MKVVLDANAAIAYSSVYSPGPLDQATAVIVPDVYFAEVTNTVWKLHTIGGMNLGEAQDLLHRTVRLPSSVVSAAHLHREAFQLAVDTKHPAYDMFYLALARLEEAILLTKDKKLGRLAQRYGVQTA